MLLFREIDDRSLLSMIQILQVPEPIASVLLCGAWLIFGFPCRR